MTYRGAASYVPDPACKNSEHGDTDESEWWMLTFDAQIVDEEPQDIEIFGVSNYLTGKPVVIGDLADHFVTYKDAWHQMQKVCREQIQVSKDTGTFHTYLT